MEQGIRIRTILRLCFIIALLMPQILFAQSCLPEGITFRTQSQIDSFPINYPNCTEIEGYVTIIPKSEIVSLQNLNAITSIGGQLMIGGCNSLSTLSGLNNLQNIGGSLTIVSNYNLMNLTALNNLRSIGFTLTIFNNDRIKTLFGLDSLDSETIGNLDISYNDSLSWCAIESVCQYISNPNGSLFIRNSIGCDSVEVVEKYCQHTMITEQRSDPQLTIYPNPFTTFTTIEYELNEISNIQFTIYNVIGEMVYETVDRIMPQGKHSFTWTADRLPMGLYYAVLRSEEGVSVVKMIKQ
ncbi:MAG: T9SS type A sorting domain-containing protein [Bacteroidetes bacterium]|nr:T9SS type A sorting domain-containing protein [Bacteroidota bacterium]